MLCFSEMALFELFQLFIIDPLLSFPPSSETTKMPSSTNTNPSTLQSSPRRERLRQAKLAPSLASGSSAPLVIPLPGISAS